MRKAVLFIITTILIIGASCEKRIKIAPDILNLPFPTEGSKDIIPEKYIN